MSTTMRAYRRGASKNGWACSTCRAPFDHGDRRRPLVFARFVGHLIRRHRRLPNEGTGWTHVQVFTWHSQGPS